jgi:hypothetical protein
MEEGRDRELVAFVPADRAADLPGGVLGGQGVDAEPLRAQLAAAVGLEEVEDLRGAGDRQHPGGLQSVDRLRDRGDALRKQPAAVGGAQHGDRQRHVRFDRLDHLAHLRGLGSGSLHNAGLRLDQDGKALHRFERGGQARARRGPLGLAADGIGLDLTVLLCLRLWHGKWEFAHPSAQKDVRFNRAFPENG